MWFGFHDSYFVIKGDTLVNLENTLGGGSKEIDVGPVQRNCFHYPVLKITPTIGRVY